MPSERFFHLPPEKRERILSAAIQEMTAHPVEELSINRIIQEADIPRGSFYQYFHDKNDLILYILEDFMGLLRERMRQLLQRENGDLIGMFYAAFQETIAYGLQENHYLFFKNTVAHILKNADVSPCLFIFQPRQLLEEWKPFLRLERYRRKDLASLEDLTELLFALMKYTAARIFSQPSLEKKEMESLRRKIVMIQTGVLLPGEEKKNV